MKNIIHVLFILPVLAGFCLFVSEPLMAQSPGGGDGNQKDKPGYKLAESTETDKSDKTPATPRQNAAEAAGAEIQALAAMPLDALVNKVKTTSDPKERAKVRMQIWNKVPQNTKELNELLDLAEAEKNNDIQRDILTAVENTKDVSLGPVFHKRMKKGDYNVRAAAIKKLAGLKYKDAVPDLIKLAEDFDYEKDHHKKESIVPFYAFLALGEIGDERSIPLVIGKLGKMNGQDAQVAAKFGKKVVPQLLEIIRTSRDEQERNEAGHAMGMIDDKDLVPEMWQISKDKNDKARYTAMNVLLNTTDTTTRPTADEVMDYITTSAKTNPAMLSDMVDVARRRKDIPYLIKTFQDPSVPRNLRTVAMDFLGEFKALSAVPALEKALQDPDKVIRWTAASALKGITGKDYSREMK